MKAAADQATILAQKIIDARLALTRLRKTHPHPRLTVPLADQKLIDQVTEMQTLSDEVQSVHKDIQAVKSSLKAGSLEVETLRGERAEAEKAVKASRVDEDDARLVPLYDWCVYPQPRMSFSRANVVFHSRYTASMTLHRSMQNVHEVHSASENELRLTYNIDSPRSQPHQITITLIFAPDTRNLAAVQTLGLEELSVDVGDVIDAHVQVNDVHGLVAAILARARAEATMS